MATAEQQTQRKNTANGFSGDDVKDKAEEIKDNFAEIIQMARDAATDKVHELLEEGSVKREMLEERLKEEPLKAVAIASIAGLALGWLLAKK